MKINYDKKRVKPPLLKVGDLIYIKVGSSREDGYHLQNLTKLSHQVAGPFPVTKVHSKLRVQLELPEYLK